MNSETAGKLLEMAARIREMREIIGYSVEQMAEKTEVSVAEYEAVEAGLVAAETLFRDAVLRDSSKADYRIPDLSHVRLPGCIKKWSGRRESNPRVKLGKLLFCH